MAVLCNNVIAGASIAEDASGGDAYKIERSIRFNDPDTPYLNRTFNKGNRKLWTFSCWVKRSKLDQYSYFFTVRESGSNYFILNFTDQAIKWYNRPTSGTHTNATSTNLYRDPAAWMHVVLVWDSAQATDSDRVRLYVNGKRVTSFSSATWPAQNEESVCNDAIHHELGAYDYGQTYNYEGYLADPQFIDGLAVPPAAFGSFDSAGNWNPKAFALPAPNDGTTWSSSSDDNGLRSGGTWAQLFDGSTSTFVTIDKSTNYAVALDSKTITCNASVGVYTITGNSVPTMKVTNTDDSVHIFDGVNNGAWTDFKHSGTIKKIELGYLGGSGSSNNFYGLRVDGVSLVDGSNDATGQTNPNDGKVWSDNFTGTFHSNGQGNAVNTFDGSLDTQSFGADASTLTFLPPQTITATGKIEIYVYTRGSITGQNDLKVNNTSIFNAVNTALGDEVWGWYDIGTTIDSTNGLVVGRHDNDNKVNIRAIKVDGTWLIDSMFNNSFHLKHNDITDDRSLGYSQVMNTCTGAQPMYGPGAEDSAKSNLVFAMPGFDLKDHSAYIKGSGSTKSITVHGDTSNTAVSAGTPGIYKFYGSSLKFDGSGDYLEVADHDDFDFGTGNFCLECWANLDDVDSGSAGWMFCVFNTSSGQNAWGLRIEGNGELNLYLSSDGGESVTVVGTSSHGMKDDTWHHIAAVRNSNTITIYVDGNSVATGSYSSAVHGSSQPLRVGRQGSSTYTQYLDGYLQDIRIYKGAAKYTSEFAPPVRGDFGVNNLFQGGDRRFTFTNVGTTFKLAIEKGMAVDSGGTPANGTTLKSLLSPTGEPPAAGSRNQFFSWRNSGTDNQQIIEYDPVIPTTSEFSVYAGSYNNSATSWTVTVTYSDDTTASNSGSSGNSDWWARSSFSTSGKSVKKVKVIAGGYSNFMGVTADNSNNVILSSANSDIDAVTDTPTNYTDDNSVVHGNYATLTPLLQGSSTTLRNGGLEVDANNNHRTIAATMGIRSGKWYWEMTRGSGDNEPSFGIKLSTLPNSTITDSVVGNPGFFIRGNEARYWDGTEYAGGLMAGVTQSQNETLGFAFDCDTGKIWARKADGTWANSGDPANGTGTIGTGFHNDIGTAYWLPCLKTYNGSGHKLNFGQQGFKFAPPTDFKGLCTQNLPDTFSGGEVNNPSKYFDIATYKGTGVSQDITGVGFQPDFVWIKSRDATYDHAAFDANRGANKRLRPNGNHQEGTDSQTLTAFNSDGFTTGTDEVTNKYGDDYVAWMWDAGTAGAANNDGSIDVTNQWKSALSGFSITKYVSNNTAGATVGHGLSNPPELIIIKNTDSTNNWNTYHKDLDNTHVVYLDLINAADDSDVLWNDDGPSNTTFTLGDGNGVNNASSHEYMAYCWTPIAGYSAFGRFTGNADADGPFNFCGFRPRWIIIKGDSYGSNWNMFDADRDPNGNICTQTLRSNSNGSEFDASAQGIYSFYIDILSNGFKLRAAGSDLNSNNNTIIWAAFAEQPFKTARSA